MLTVMMIAGYCAVAVADERDALRNHPGPVAIPFELRDGYQIFVTGRDAKGKNLRMLVELGTTRTIVDTRVASRLMGPEEVKDLVAASGMTKVRLGVISELHFGPMTLNEIGVLVTDLASFPGAPPGTDVIVGLDVLTRNDLTVDFKNGLLIFATDRTLPNEAAITWTEGLAILNMTARDETLRMVLSTGVHFITLDKKRAEHWVASNKKLRSTTLSTEDIVIPVRVADTPEFALNHRKLFGPAVVLTITQRSTRDDLQGILPLAALNADRVSIDFQGRVLRWNDASSYRFEPAALVH